MSYREFVEWVAFSEITPWGETFGSDPQEIRDELERARRLALHRRMKADGLIP